VIVLDTHALVWWWRMRRSSRPRETRHRRSITRGTSDRLGDQPVRDRHRGSQGRWCSASRGTVAGRPAMLPELHFEPVSAGIAQLAGSFDDAAPGDPAIASSPRPRFAWNRGSSRGPAAAPHARLEALCEILLRIENQLRAAKQRELAPLFSVSDDASRLASCAQVHGARSRGACLPARY